MNFSKTMVVCDSGCDISAELAAKYDIRIISLGINYRAKTFTDIQLEKDDPLYVYKHFKEEVPHTASLNMADVLDALEKGYGDGYRNVIGITISGAMSSTFNVMRNALDEYSDEHPEARTFAFDTKNISFGSGVFAVYAALKLAQGASFDNTVESLKKKIYDSHLAFYMDTLDYLRKGGRITPSVALVGKLLGIKPIISCNHEGTYYTVAKIRGMGRGVAHLVECVLPQGLDDSNLWVAILNGCGEEQAERAKQLILARYPHVQIIEEKQIVSTMAIHTGPGLVGIISFDLGGAYPKNPIRESIDRMVDRNYALGEKISEQKERFDRSLDNMKKNRED